MRLRDFIEDSNIITEAVSAESKSIRREAAKDLLSLKDDIRKIELKAEKLNKKYIDKIHDGKYSGDDWVISQKFRNVVGKLKDLYLVIDNGAKKMTK